MRTKQVVFEDGTKFMMRSMPTKTHYALQKEYQASDDLVDYSRKFIVASISEWNVKNEKGEVVPVTEENFDDHTTAEYLDELMKAANYVNGVPDKEKKTSLPPPATPSSGQ